MAHLQSREVSLSTRNVPDNVYLVVKELKGYLPFHFAVVKQEKFTLFRGIL